MLIKIPFDIWRDVFDFLSTADRKQLALKFNEVGDREFSDLCQKWLHEWTKNICIGHLFIGSEDGKSARLLQYSEIEVAYFEEEELDNLPFADTELPANIHSFKSLNIRHFDSTVLRFLHRMQPLFHRIDLDAYCDDKSLETTSSALVHLLPLLTGGIECFQLYSDSTSNSSQLLFTIRDRFPIHFFAIKTLLMNKFNPIGSLMNTFNQPIGIRKFVQLHLPWLSTRLADGQPRVLILQSDETLALKLINRIRQHFLGATSPVSFFIRLLWNLKFRAIHDSISTNAETNEQLIIRKPEEEEEEVLHIGRCSSNLDSQTWVEEMDRRWVAAEEQKAQRRISIYCLTDGSLEEELGANEREAGNREEEEDPDQPGPSSKKPNRKKREMDIGQPLLLEDA